MFIRIITVLKTLQKPRTKRNFVSFLCAKMGSNILNFYSNAIEYPNFFKLPLVDPTIIFTQIYRTTGRNPVDFSCILAFKTSSPVMSFKSVLPVLHLSGEKVNLKVISKLFNLYFQSLLLCNITTPSSTLFIT